MKQRPRAVAKARVQKKHPSYVPEFLLFLIVVVMVWVGYWAFWSTR